MEKVRVQKAQLLEILKANRTQHREVFLKAVEGYRAEAIALLEAHIDRLAVGKLVQVHVNMASPTDQTADYDRVIGMLEMGEDAVVLLSEQDYSQYVLDKWQWKQAWAISNKKYYGASYTTAAQAIPASYDAETE